MTRVDLTVESAIAQQSEFDSRRGSLKNTYMREWYEDIDIDGKDSNGNDVGYDEVDDSPYRPVYPDEPSYMYQFKNKETLMSSEVFQQCLSQSLAFKDKTIRDLQNELLSMV